MHVPKHHLLWHLIWLLGAVLHPTESIKESGATHHRFLVEDYAKIKATVDAKLGTKLTQLRDRDASVASQSPILVDIAFDQPVDNLRAAWLLGITSHEEEEDEAAKEVGGAFQVINCLENMCSALLPASKLAAIAQVDAVHYVSRVQFGTDGGAVTSEDGKAMYSDIASAQFNVAGEGIRIGVISNSYDCLKQAETDIQNGDLPPASNIRILQDFGPLLCNIYGGDDEGRAMMQLIHDVAPEALLAFRTGSRGTVDMAVGILALGAAGCDVIVDDLYYSNEPFFQDGILSQAINRVVSQYGIPYFTAAGNRGRRSWETSTGFDEVIVAGASFHRFGTDASGDPIIFQKITMRNSDFTRIISMQWDDPFYSPLSPAARTDLDILVRVNGEIIDMGLDLNIGRQPTEEVEFNPAEYSEEEIVTVELAIVLASGPLPTWVKYVVFGSIISIEFPTYSPTSVGHKTAALGAGVAAAYWNDTTAFGVSPPIVEAFSSVGGTPILFDRNGNRLENPVVRQQPRFTGPDGGATTFFGDDSIDGVWRFFGTSAASPNVAALASLLLELNRGPKSLTPEEIYAILANTAIDMDDNFTIGFDTGYDFNTGTGFVNASAALNSLGIPPLSKKPAPPCGFFGLSLFCPITLCGMFGKMLGLCAA